MLFLPRMCPAPASFAHSSCAHPALALRSGQQSSPGHGHALALLSLLYDIQLGQHLPAEAALPQPGQNALPPSCERQASSQPAVGSGLSPKAQLNGPGWVLHTWEPSPAPCRVWSGARAAHALTQPGSHGGGPGSSGPLPLRSQGARDRPPSLPVCFQGVCVWCCAEHPEGQSHSAAAQGGDSEEGWRILPAPPPQSPFHPVFLHKAHSEVLFLLPSFPTHPPAHSAPVTA